MRHRVQDHASRQLTVLATFTGPNGAIPYGPVTLAGNTLYGTTSEGGSSNNGVIFSVNTDGSNFQVLHQFSNKDGSYPIGTVLTGPATLYGVTYNGGPVGYGELYQLNKDGTLVVLHAFNKQSGSNPSDLRFGADGMIYGATDHGGTVDCGSKLGCGVMFSYDLKSAAFTKLYRFTGHKNGGSPVLGSIDSQGNIYGATGYGPVNTTGTLFELSPGPNGYTLTTLADLRGHFGIRSERLT